MAYDPKELLGLLGIGLDDSGTFAPEYELTFDDIISKAKSAPEDTFIARGNDVYRGSREDEDSAMSVLAPILEKANLSGASYSKMPDNLAPRLSEKGFSPEEVALGSDAYDLESALKLISQGQAATKLEDDRDLLRLLESDKLRSNEAVVQTQEQGATAREELKGRNALDVVGKRGDIDFKSLKASLDSAEKINKLEGILKLILDDNVYKRLRYSTDAEAKALRASLAATLRGKEMERDTALELSEEETNRLKESIWSAMAGKELDSSTALALSDKETDRALLGERGLAERLGAKILGDQRMAEISSSEADKNNRREYALALLKLIMGGKLDESRLALEQRDMDLKEKLSQPAYLEAMSRLQALIGPRR